MNIKRYGLAAVAVFAFMFAFEFFWHGILLHDQYEATKALWRSEQDFEAFFPLAIAVTVVLALLISFIFTRHYESCGLGEGVRFGVMLGLLMGVLQFGIYPYLPIPLGLAVSWFLGATLEGIGIGIVLALIYRN